jgi:hypothetical protein
VQTIVLPWSWKSAVFTVLLRGLTFFVANISGGERVAIQALFVESVYALFATGQAGETSQHSRNTKPIAKRSEVFF